MSTMIDDTLDEEEELKLDEEFRIENEEMIKNTFKQLDREKNIVNLHTELVSYLDNHALTGVIFKNLSIENLFIQIDS